MPWELLGNIKHAYSNKPYAPKLYGMDGYISLWQHDSNNDGIIKGSGEFAYLYAGMRRGGNNYYALDVTQKNSPELMWTIKGGQGDFVDMGQSWSKMVQGKFPHPTTGAIVDVMVFSGGYDVNQDTTSRRATDRRGNSLYIVDAKTGNLIWQAGNNANASLQLSAMQYSIPATPTVIDVDSDGVFDQIYVGDMGGQVWRFDFPSTGPVSGGVIADLSDSTSGAVRFFASPDVALHIGADGPYLTVSIGSGSRSQPLAAEDNDFFVLRQHDIHNAPAGYGYQLLNQNRFLPLTRTQLVDITDNKIADGTAAERAAVRDELDESHGWFLDLDNNGEKVFNTSISVDSKVIFTSYLPSAQSGCSIDPGANNLYILNLLDGTAALDINDNGVLERAERVLSLNAPGISAPPTTIFTNTPDGGIDVQVVVGTESFSIGDVPLLRRTHWSETPEF